MQEEMITLKKKQHLGDHGSSFWEKTCQVSVDAYSKVFGK